MTSATEAVASVQVEDAETSEARSERWKKLGLQVVPVRIVDITSAPLEGVRVAVDGVHMGQGGKTSGHGGWNVQRDGPAPVDTTDSDGRALLASPVVISELTMATGISFNASKSGYSKRRIMEYPVDGSERDEVLRRGNTLIVAAYIGNRSVPVSDFTPDASWGTQLRPEDWISLPDGRKMTDIVPDGKHALTLKRNADGMTWHSETVAFEIKGGETKELHVVMNQALGLRGRLSDNVPRPVKAGKVVACAQWPPPGRKSADEEMVTMRQSSADVAEDGTFIIPDLPEGPGEIIGVCDGYIASHREPGAKPYQQNQIYDLTPQNSAEAFVLRMEPGGVLRVRVQDPAGNPIPGAQVASWPNVFWSVKASSIYVDSERWSSKTDAQGKAEIGSLRAGNLFFLVSAKGWNVPATVDGSGRVIRDLRAEIISGSTTEVTVTMEPGGE